MYKKKSCTVVYQYVAQQCTECPPCAALRMQHYAVVSLKHLHLFVYTGRWVCCIVVRSVQIWYRENTTWRCECGAGRRRLGLVGEGWSWGWWHEGMAWEQTCMCLFYLVVDKGPLAVISIARINTREAIYCVEWGSIVPGSACADTFEQTQPFCLVLTAGFWGMTSSIQCFFREQHRYAKFHI